MRGGSPFIFIRRPFIFRIGNIRGKDFASNQKFHQNRRDAFRKSANPTRMDGSKQSRSIHFDQVSSGSQTYIHLALARREGFFEVKKRF